MWYFADVVNCQSETKPHNMIYPYQILSELYATHDPLIYYDHGVFMHCTNWPTIKCVTNFRKTNSTSNKK